MGRCFEKISFEQFQKDISDDINLYNEYNLPKRSTKNSAGYDFSILFDVILNPMEIKKIPTGIKAKMEFDELLQIYIRSSIGVKYNGRMTNQVGIIDSDYYNNTSNEGHIWISIQNEGKDSFTLKKGDRIAQGVFMKYLTIDNEKPNNIIRLGGFGSTN